MYKKLLILALFCNVVFSAWETLSLPNNFIDECISTDNTIFCVSFEGNVYASYDEGVSWELIVEMHVDLLPYGFEVFKKVENYLFISQNIAPPYYNYRADINIGEWELIPYQDSALSKCVVYGNYIYALSILNEGILRSNDFGSNWEIIS